VIEKHIVLEDIDPVVFYGIGNQHLQMLRALYPKLRIVARDNVIRILGDEEQMAAFEEATEKLRQHVIRFNALKEEDILDIVKGHRTKDEVPEGVVCYSMSGRAIKARSETSNGSSTPTTRTTWCSPWDLRERVRPTSPSHWPCEH
jgi:phosphate starvation-inducible PhoH-like protein